MVNNLHEQIREGGKLLMFQLHTLARRADGSWKRTTAQGPWPKAAGVWEVEDHTFQSWQTARTHWLKTQHGKTFHSIKAL